MSLKPSKRFLKDSRSQSSLSLTKQDFSHFKSESEWNPYLNRTLRAKPIERPNFTRTVTLKAIQQSINIKTQIKDLKLLKRIKPQSFQMEKERLYEENLSLKQSYNNVVAELVRIKTKCAQLQKELKKTDESSQVTFSLNKSKISLEDFRTGPLNKEWELGEMNKRDNYRKASECEMQLNYNDEYKRFQYKLEEVLNNHFPTLSPSGSLVTKKSEDNIVKKLKGEVRALSEEVGKRNKENLKLCIRIADLESKLKISAENNEEIQLQIKKAQRQNRDFKECIQDEAADLKESEYKGIIRKAEKDLEMKNLENEKLRNEVESKKKEYEELKKSMENERDYKNKDAEQINKAVFKQIQASNGEHEKLVENLRKEIENKDKEFDKIAKNLQLDIESKDRECEKIKKKLHLEIESIERECEKNMKKFQLEIETKERDYGNILKKLQLEIDNKDQRHEKEINKLQLDIVDKDQKYEKEINKLQLEIENKDKKLQLDIGKKDEKYKKIIQELQQDLEIKDKKFEKVIQKLQLDLETRENEIVCKDREHEKNTKQLQQELESKTQEHEKISKKFQLVIEAKDQEIESKNQEHEKAVKQLQQDYESKFKEYKKIMEKLNLEIETKKIEIEFKDQEHEKLIKQSKQEFESRIQECERMIEILEQESDIKDKEYQSAQLKINRLESEKDKKELNPDYEISHTINEVKLNSMKQELEGKMKEWENIENAKKNELDLKEKEEDEKTQSNNIKEGDKILSGIAKKMKNDLKKKNKEFELLVNKLLETETKVKDLEINIDQKNKTLSELQDQLKISTHKKNFPPKFFRILNNILSTDKIELSQLLDLLFTKDPLSISELSTNLTKLRKNIKKSTISEVSGFLKQSNNLISRPRTELFFNEFIYDPTDLGSEDDSESLQQPDSILRTDLQNKTQLSFLNLETPEQNIKTPTKTVTFQEPDDQDPVDSTQNIKIEADMFAEKLFKEETQNTPKEEPSGDSIRFSEKDQEFQDTPKHTDPPETVEELQTSIITQNVSPAILTPNIKNSIIEQLFHKFALKLQINNIPKASIVFHLFPYFAVTHEITEFDLLERLQASPYKFTYRESKCLSFNFFTQSTLSLSSLQQKLSESIEDWEIPSKQQKFKFESQLKKIISKNFSVLKKNCEKIDKFKTQKISTQEFKETIQKLEIQFPGETLNYFLLLCYEHEQKLDEVPYNVMLQRWYEAKDESKDQPSEETRKIARHYLEIIAKVLIQNKTRAKYVFMTNGKGMISPKDFLDGLERLGLRNIELEFKIALLDALHFEGSEEHFISLRELEAILGFYGVGREAEERVDERIVERPVESQDKISELDSVECGIASERQLLDVGREEELDN